MFQCVSKPREMLDRAVAGAGPHQGVVAFGAAERFATLEETIAAGGMHVVLDGVEDPHNLGAIVRTAHAAGASAIVDPGKARRRIDGSGCARSGRGARLYAGGARDERQPVARRL